MIEHGHETKKLIKDIDDIIIKTILCATPTLKHNYKTAFPKCERGSSCFELLGFDNLVDRHLRPTLIEVLRLMVFSNLLYLNYIPAD
jgi:tubulin polyglutamylase TTLL6/13